MQAESSFVTFIRDCISGLNIGFQNCIWSVAKGHFRGSLRNIATSFHTPSNRKITRISGEKKELQVIGVGAGRTGTYSLKLALDRLGYNTLHTQHIFEIPEILNLWFDLVFEPSIEKNEVLYGEKQDIFEIFDATTVQGYNAVMDLPAALYVEELYERYPNAKFILSTRENSEVWFDSFQSMQNSVESATNKGAYIYEHVHQIAIYFRWLRAIYNQDKEALHVPVGDALPKLIKETAIEVYETHNQKVKRKIPPNQLLEYQIGMGWQPLCDFLNVDHCPKESFPRTNSKVAVEAQAISSIFLWYCGLVLCFYFLMKKFMPLVTMRYQFKPRNKIKL